MAKPITKTAYLCDRCGKEYEKASLADSCYAEDLKQEKFLALVKRYKELQKKIKKDCTHKHGGIISRDEHETFYLCRYCDDVLRETP